MWFIKESMEGEEVSYLILQKELEFDVQSKLIVDKEEFKFFLLFYGQKLAGYKVVCKNVDRYNYHNAIAIFYSTPKVGDKPKLEILYEDSTIRLLEFCHEGANDYWVVGRWRNNKEQQ